jgi:beta-glucanase (GH16 family)
MEAPVIPQWIEQYEGQELNLSGYKLTFVDEFETMEIADGDYGVRDGVVRKWYSPARASYGGATFVSPQSAVSPLSVRDGVLAITMEQVNSRWQSGTIQTADWRYDGWKQGYGYYEMRARFDRGNDYGSWPAFWLISQLGSEKEGWGTRIEYDILEAYSTDPDGHHTALHVRNSSGKTGTSEYTRVGSPDAGMFDGNYHTYGGLVTEDWIITYMDGRELTRTRTPQEVKNNAQFHMIISLAMNPDEVTRASGRYRMDVDYVRAYAPDPRGSTTAPSKAVPAQPAPALGPSVRPPAGSRSSTGGS